MTLTQEATLRSAETLRGYKIHASDGEIGTVDQFLFDDESWTIRYLVVNTGNWLLERLVLISPISIERIDWDREMVDLALTRQQVEDSPSIAADEPVSRQLEAEYLRYYGYPPYWEGPGLWGETMYPPYSGFAGAVAPPYEARPEMAPPAPATEVEQQGDPHLRSSHEVKGYHLHAHDGEIGHVEDFILDDATWSIRYMVVDTRNWWPGKKVLISTQWIQSVDWATQLVSVDLSRETIKHSPEYDPDQMINRAYEMELHSHYDRPGYWQETTG